MYQTALCADSRGALPEFHNQKSTEGTPAAVQPLPERVTFSHGGLREKRSKNNTTTRDDWSQGCFSKLSAAFFVRLRTKKRPVSAQRFKQFSKKRLPSPEVGRPRSAVSRPYSLLPGHPLRPSPRPPASPGENHQTRAYEVTTVHPSVVAPKTKFPARPAAPSHGSPRFQVVPTRFLDFELLPTLGQGNHFPKAKKD